jgi:hypothetical protein
MLDDFEAEIIARIRYLGWCCYQLGVKSAIRTFEDAEQFEKYKQMGLTQFSWEPTDAQLQSLIQGVKFLAEKGSDDPEANHNNWMETKKKEGWVYGPVKDFEKKTHPDMVPYDELIEVERAKDDMDVTTQEQAIKILEGMWRIPCPVWQCGGFMNTVEREMPQDFADEHSDGYPGSFQEPDLVCENCGTTYVRSSRRDDDGQNQG